MRDYYTIGVGIFQHKTGIFSYICAFLYCKRALYVSLGIFLGFFHYLPETLHSNALFLLVVFFSMEEYYLIALLLVPAQSFSNTSEF